MRYKSIVKIVFLSASVLLLSGCDEEKYQLKFSHSLHVTENEMACDECHGDLGGASFTAMSHETCIDCHDEPEEKEIKPSTCGYCHDGELGEILRDSKAEPEAPRKTVFVHTEALAGKCQECHEPIMEEDLTFVPKLKRADIIKIRDDAHASGKDCLTCHVDMDRHQEPADHTKFWMQRHGQFGTQLDAACSVCHSEESCTECHSVMQPRSHNNQWRLRTHGVVAAWDRQDCMVCHQEDSCSSCHSQASPRSHRGRWSAMGKKPTHCIGCHTAATAGEGCVVCHEEGNNVLLHQDFWPTGADGGTPHDLLGDSVNCYECHWSSITD